MTKTMKEHLPRRIMESPVVDKNHHCWGRWIKGNLVCRLCRAKYACKIEAEGRSQNAT